MIQATCSACGTVNRVAEGDVPAGSKFLTCASCKARVALPQASGGTGSVPKIPARPPAIPTAKRSELADLPAPKRQGPLSGIEGAKPAPKSGLDLSDLPAPKGPSESAKPASKPKFDLADLPAPKGPKPALPPQLRRDAGPGGSPGPGAAAQAEPQSAASLDLAWGSDASVDLPAPKPKGSAPSLSADAAAALDLPAPKANPKAGKPPATPGAATPFDLPAPKSPSSRGGIDLGGADLPAPKPKSPGTPAAPPPSHAGDTGLDIIDLPAPKASTGIQDLPTPKTKVPGQRPPALPAQATSNSSLDIIDLPAPKGISDLPMPKPGANLDLPAPKGFFDDLPQPAAAAKQAPTDLVAPKGFFDDLPQPAKAPHNSPNAAGFFDDLPVPSRPAAPLPPPPSAGFFDDDQLAPRRPAAPPSPPSAGFFDDQAAPAANASPAAASGVFDDLPEPTARPAAFDLDLSPSGASAAEAEPAAAEAGAAAKLDLDLPSSGGDFADLDLSAPSSPPPPPAKTGISIKSNSTAAAPKSSEAVIEAPAKGGPELNLELEDESTRVAQVQFARDREPQKQAAVGRMPVAEAKKPKRKAVLIGGAVAVVVLGLGGELFYRHHSAQQKRAAELAEHLRAARVAIHSDQADHWNKAGTEASAALAVDEHNKPAIGLRAEALLAGALDTGVGGETRIAQGRRVLSDALDKNLSGPDLDTAQALASIAANQANQSLAKLDDSLKREPSNAFLHIYKGWAHAAMNDPKGAVQEFDAALAADPNTKLPALYARGRAKLQLLDLEGAKADFAAVLAIAKDHIGAQVGLAASLPASQSQQREADLLAVLERKDIASGDPRAVVYAWTLAGDIARNNDRLDVARERYRQALALSKLDVPALVGLARVELRDGRLAIAADLVKKALGQRADDLEAMLAGAEVSVRQGKIDEAFAITTKLASRVPPLLPLQRARLQLVVGNMLEAQSKDDEAIDAWVEGAKAAGDLDLAPMMAAVTKLGALAKKATDSHDDKKAADYRSRADELLSSLADRAHADPYLAKTLGAAYLDSGDLSKAEGFLRRAVELRGSDIDSRLMLARTLASMRRPDDALQQLQAAQALDTSRLDISLEVARTLEGAHRDSEAAAEYTKLISHKDASIQARIHAGRFLARRGDFKHAGEQAEAILRAEPDNAAGHYLKGEGLMFANKLDDARRELTLAVDADPDPQYLDAQGRAAEASVASTSDTKFYDLALRAYERAIDVDATMFNPQAGTGRIYVARKEWSKAAAPLAAAIKIDPKNTDVMYNLGVTYKNLGHVPESIEWLEAAIRAKPDPDAYWQLAQLYQDADRGHETANALNQATRLARDKETSQGTKIEWLSEAWYRLGQIELGLHNDAAAKAAYEMYVGRNPPAGAQLSEARRLLSTTLR